MRSAEAPGFLLRDQHGQSVSLFSFRGRKPVLLVFFPFAFSRVCTGELQELQHNAPRLEALGAQILAVSCDPMFSLRAASDTEGLAFPLLSDFWPHGAVSTAYGVFDAVKGCSNRSSFLVDRAGVLRWQVHSAMPEARNLQEYVDALDALDALEPERKETP